MDSKRRHYYIIPNNTQHTEYHGILNVNQTTFTVKMLSTTKIRFTCDQDLRNVLKQNHITFEKISLGCTKLEEVLDKLYNVLTDVMPKASSQPVCPEQSIAIIHHLKEIGWENVNKVSNDFSRVEFHATICNRCHKLVVRFEQSYPDNDPVIDVQLPIAFKPLITSKDNKMKDIYLQFKAVLPLLQRFWDDVENLQENALIMEPENPDFSHTKYRISIGKKASVVFTIDPMHLENPPECKFLGPESLTMQENFISQFDSWNENLTILQNLNNILMMEIPTKNSRSASEINFNCGICYCFRLGTEVPDQYCVNNHCHQIYHHCCLLQWIQSIPGCKQSFNTLFGSCLYCNAKMTMSVSS